MCHQHRLHPIDSPRPKPDPNIRLSCSISLTLNRLIELVRLETGNDKVEFMRQILWRYFREHRPDLIDAVTI